MGNRKYAEKGGRESFRGLISKMKKGGAQNKNIGQNVGSSDTLRLFTISLISHDDWFEEYKAND